MAFARFLIVLLLSEIFAILLATSLLSVIVYGVLSAKRQAGKATAIGRGTSPRPAQSWRRADLRRTGLVIGTEAI